MKSLPSDIITHRMNGLSYLPIYTSDARICFFYDQSAVIWAKHMLRLYLRPRPILLTTKYKYENVWLLEFYVNHYHLGYACQLEYQPEFLRRLPKTQEIP